MSTIDQFDLKILQALQRDGHMPLRELSECVGLSQTPCHLRKKQLEDRGLISSYHAQINLIPNKDVHLVLMLVSLPHHRAKDFAKFESNVLRFPEIVECHSLAGRRDYLLKVASNNQQEYKAIVTELFGEDSGFVKYLAYPVSWENKKNTGVPLMHIYHKKIDLQIDQKK